MPERNFTGLCPDCGQMTEVPLLVRWKNKPWLKLDRESPLAEWIIAHHVDAPVSMCNMVRLIELTKNQNIDHGFILVTRSEKFLQTQRPQDVLISDFMFY